MTLSIATFFKRSFNSQTGQKFKMFATQLRQFTKSASELDMLAKKEQKVKIGKYYINYLKIGNGPHKAICTPGALGTIWSCFKWQISGFDLEKFTLVLWDPVGHGKSRPPKRVFSRQNYEKDADTAYELMKYLQIPEYSCIGFCAGGSASCVLAAKYPEVINKLVIWGAKPFVLPSDMDIYKKSRDLKRWSPITREAYEKVYGHYCLEKYWCEMIDSMLVEFESNPDICSEYVNNITCPTFLLHGSKDPHLTNFHLWYLRKQIKNLTFYTYTEGEHTIHMKYADDFNKRVQEFLLQPEKTNLNTKFTFLSK